MPNDPEELREWLRLHGGPSTLADAFSEFRNEVIEVPAAPDEPRTLAVTVTLRETEPPVWRRLVVPGAVDLGRFHDVLQAAMGWSDSHLHHFTLSDDPRASYFLADFDAEEGDDGTPEHQVRLDQVLREVGDRLFYAYDFGDGWEHVVELESVEALEEGARARCIDGRRACPPEDCGGIPGYEQLVDWHDAGRTEASLPDGFESLDHAESWLPDGWEPDRFEPAEADSLLAAAHEAERRMSSLHLDLAALLAITPPLPVVDQWLGRLPTEAPTSEEVSAGTRHWQVLLECWGDHVRLTSAGWLPPAVVSRTNEALGKPEPYGKGNREQNTLPVLELREAAQTLGLYRKRKGALEITRRGLDSHTPDACWRHVRERLPLGREDAAREAGWLALLGLAAGLSPDELRQPVAMLMSARGWRGGAHGGPIDEWQAYHLYRGTVVALLGPAYWTLRRQDSVPAWARALAADTVRSRS